MYLHNLIAKVLFKAAPMEPAEFASLKTDMEVWFDKQKTAVRLKENDKENPQPLTMKDKIFKFMDSWYCRAIFAALYVFIIRWVQDWMNPDEPEHFDDLPDPNAR